jgi:glycosyltransferase involved in cell wall biosynthesis
VARALIIVCNRYAFDARTQRHAEALADRGYDTDVICLAGPMLDKYQRVNLIELSYPVYQGAWRRSYLRTYLRFLLSAGLIALRRSFTKPYDLVIASSMPDAIVLCAWPAKLFGSKVLLDVRDTMPELYWDKFGTWKTVATRALFAEERLSAWLADRVLAVHEPHRLRLERAGIPTKKIGVVMNSPDPRIFANHNHRPDVPSEPFTIVYHGTVTYRLGLDVALHAMHLLRYRIPSLRLLVLGSGDALESVKSLAISLGLEQTVMFSKLVPVGDLPAVLSQAAVGLVPNRASPATHLMLPVKLLEYAMSRVPVIAARLDTIQHYFDEQAVRYFTPGDPVDLSVAIEELYRDPKQRDQLSRRAAEIANRLNWLDERNEYYRAIDSLIGETGTHSNGVRH